MLIWIHLVAAITWIGGMLFHRMVLKPALARVSLPDRQADPPVKGQDVLAGILIRIETRYKTLRWLSLATLLATGIVLLLHEGGSTRLESTWGAWLMLKLLFVLIVIGLTAIHDVGMAPVHPNPAGLPIAPPGRSAAFIADTILALGLVIVFIAAYLVQS
ncbi:MAG: CopD family protein, partial [Nitrospirae bacterium]|nr:CopD family protein [Nitrospirota bacterium]